MPEPLQRMPRNEPTQLDQFATFEQLAPEFAATVSFLTQAGDVSRWVHDTWTEANESILRQLLPRPEIAFLRVQDIAAMMFVDAGGQWLDHQAAYLARHYEAEVLQWLLQENIVGGPRLCSSSPVTSHNSVHHLYHLTFFEQETGVSLSPSDVVVEWGGGYGNLVKIQRRRTPQLTNIVVDTPLFTALQWLYLSSVLGPDQVNLVRSEDDDLLEGKVNLVSLPFVHALDVKADLFVSTWALSESTPAAQQFVAERDWFGARHLLLAVQDDPRSWPDAFDVHRIAVAAGARSIPMSFLPQSHYALL